MPHSEPTQPAFWLMLQLPLSESDRTSRLAALLHTLRIPAAVHHSMLTAGGTFAMIPSDGAGSILTVPDSYSPTVEWASIDIDTVANAVEKEFGPGGALGGSLLSDDASIHDADHGMSVADAPAPVDAIAWTTRKKQDVLAILGSRVDMSFDAVDADAWGRALRPHRAEDRGRAFEQGLWAMTDGVAVWRSGTEYAAAFVRRRQPFVFAWGRAWIHVDPGKPGQLVGGTSIRTLLDTIHAVDDDAGAWIARFRLDSATASRLRTLFRRDARPGILDELFEILALPRGCVDLLDDDGEASPDVIHPRGARAQFRDGMRDDAAAAASRDSFRHRRPRLWIALSLCGIVVLTAFAIAGLTAGRPTAFLPGLIAVLWAVSLVVDGAFARARRVGGHTSADPET